MTTWDDPATFPPSAATDGVERGAYTWDMAVKDLALTTVLTLHEAHNLTWPIRDHVHPYDAMPLLQHLAASGINARRVGSALADLLELPNP